MTRILALLCLPAACCAATASADERIFDANNVEALTLAVSRLGADLQSVARAGTLVLNRVEGPQIEFGYSNSRTRAVFGVPGFYTRFELALGLSRQDFAGNSIDPSTGAVVASSGPFDVQTAAMRGRIGYGWEFGPDRRAALTPFVGFAQQAWLRRATVVSGTTANLQNVVEIGLLAQSTLSPRIVFGADGSVGHVLGAWQADSRNVFVPSGRIASSFSVYLDHRTAADTHERIVLRQSSLRFGDPVQATGSLEPRRNSALTIGLEFGTEGRLLEELFY
jgi:hypothetical protein